MGKLIRNEKVLTGAVDMNIVSLTRAEYNALSEEEKMSGKIFEITDSNVFPNAERIQYDNSVSKLDAHNVQDAIDVLNTKMSKKVFNSYEYAMASSDKHSDNSYYKALDFKIPNYFGIRITSFINPACELFYYVQKDASGNYTIHKTTPIYQETQGVMSLNVSSDKKSLYVKSTYNSRFYVETTQDMTFENY